MVEIISPNRGHAVKDTELAAVRGISQDEFRESYGIDKSKQIRLLKVSHMRYQHEELDVITQFLHDFGLIIAKKTDDEIWFKGYGPDQYVYYIKKGPKKFLGGSFQVESYEDLVKASQLPGATDIQPLHNAPGGGFIVTIRDPLDFPVNLIFGQDAVENAAEVPEPLTTNYEISKSRIRKFQRFEPGPAAVFKLGHFGLCVTDIDRQLDFYFHTFNLVPTDFMVVDDNGTTVKVGAFCHIDREDDYTDHHTFFIAKAGSSHPHHCSFEVHDFDTQMLGHEWLAKRYKNASVWGVGRHILGSQIFDYWWDTSGFMVEHYADGDIVNKDTPVNLVPANDELLAVWGPELPAGFLD